MPPILLAFLCLDSPARTPHSSKDGVSPQLLDLHLAQSFRAISQVLAQALQIATASLSSGIIQSGHEETSNVLSCVESSWVFNAGTPAYPAPTDMLFKTQDLPKLLL